MHTMYIPASRKLINVKLQGLDPNKTYKVEEINLMPGVDSALKSNGQTYTGDYLMKVGIEVFGFAATQSHVLELTAM